MESLSCKSYKNVKILRATTNTKRPASCAIPIVDPEVLSTTGILLVPVLLQQHKKL
jgi:hypothetical protein